MAFRYSSTDFAPDGAKIRAATAYRISPGIGTLLEFRLGQIAETAVLALQVGARLGVWDLTPPEFGGSTLEGGGYRPRILTWFGIGARFGG